MFLQLSVAGRHLSRSPVIPCFSAPVKLTIYTGPVTLFLCQFVFSWLWKSFSVCGFWIIEFWIGGLTVFEENLDWLFGFWIENCLLCLFCELFWCVLWACMSLSSLFVLSHRDSPAVRDHAEDVGTSSRHLVHLTNSVILSYHSSAFTPLYTTTQLQPALSPRRVTTEDFQCHHYQLRGLKSPSKVPSPAPYTTAQTHFR